MNNINQAEKRKKKKKKKWCRDFQSNFSFQSQCRQINTKVTNIMHKTGTKEILENKTQLGEETEWRSLGFVLSQSKIINQEGNNGKNSNSES